MEGKITKHGFYFEIDLVTSDGEAIAVNALFDSGFTSGILAIHIQDIEAFGWRLIRTDRIPTANGEADFNVYEGRVIIDGHVLTVPVHTGHLPEEDRVLLGYQALEFMTLFVDSRRKIVTLELK